ncbi:hypothetical protein EHO61_01955 [Leptospira fluminis]|uniref:Cys-rich protein n=1 Tax=Leptospira fluminis TaxID=2484979 RepID=A0A4R9GTR5_9LEPT|nr:hypothetical protein [Leptospira fluminis]TGK22019.1 hypothetical protein EHO61_01955 [Leptospira fluminis]
MKQFFGTSATIFAFWALFSLSAQPGPPDDSKNPCAADRQTFCKNIPHGPELHDCMHANESKFSAVCKSHLSEMKAKHDAVKQACSADEQKFCSNTGHGHGGPMGCLRSHESELSAACKAALPPPRR